MEPDQWRRVRAIFERAVSVPADARAAYLDAACAGAPGDRREVESLLEHHEQDPAFLDAGVGPIAADLMTESTAPLLSAGQQLGPYVVERQLGRGGMGVVYLARDTRLDRPVALKLLPPEVGHDARRRERLRREARAAAAVPHPGVAHVYALEETDDGTCFIVSEYVPGHSLRQEIADGPLEAADVVQTAVQVAEALAAAHDRGIVHRDLKPENVIRTPEGAVKVLDFGLARQPSGAGVARLTEAGALVGTPDYMSPEQLRGQETGPASDIFSLGLLIHEMATGTHAFASERAASLVAGILEGRPAPLPDGVRAALPGLEAIVARCLQKDPARRHASMHELADALSATGPAPAGDHDPPPAALPSGRPDNEPIDRSGLWWWQFHQWAVCGLHALGFAGAWAAGLPDVGGAWYRLLLIVLAGAVTLSATARLHLLFTARVRPAHLAAARDRAMLWTQVPDALAAVLVLAAAGVALLGDQFWLAAGLAALSTGGIVGILLIEPATSHAAFPPGAPGRLRDTP